ncbi:MAG: hypothetical protein NTW59_03285 [Candidatus Diapherotrites archaeon]|nr:hypothetical protein [Candidatus Diapherotrites archaeon]
MVLKPRGPTAEECIDLSLERLRRRFWPVVGDAFRRGELDQYDATLLQNLVSHKFLAVDELKQMLRKRSPQEISAALVLYRREALTWEGFKNMCLTFSRGEFKREIGAALDGLLRKEQEAKGDV